MLSRTENPWMLIGSLCVGIFLMFALMLLPQFIMALLIVGATVIIGIWMISARAKEEADQAMHSRAGREATLMTQDELGFMTETAIVSHSPRVDWLPRAILSGFIAATAMLAMFFVAYGVAVLFSAGVAEAQGTASQSTMTRWLYNLTHNSITDMGQTSLYFVMGAHLAVSLIMAGIYAYFFEPHVSGPGWAKGVYFSVIPLILSIVVFFPLVGGGFLGSALGAGPLPYAGNALLHLVFGATLGLMYGPVGDTLPWMEETHSTENRMAMQHAEKAAAIGIMCGMLLGLLAGIGDQVAIRGATVTDATALLTILGLVLTGGAFGALAGTMFGLPMRSEMARNS